MSTVDLVTGEAMVVLQDRPVAALSPWLAEAVAECADTSRALQLVTPESSRLSVPLRLALTGPSRWVVRADGGYYDGLAGTPLRWTGAAFTPVGAAGDYAPPYAGLPIGPIGTQLTISLRARHLPEVRLGGAVERVFSVLTGQPPAGWGPAEPILYPWDRADLTAHSTLAFIGGGTGRTAAGTLRVSPAKDGGIAEAATIVIGNPPGVEPQLAALPALAGELTGEYAATSVFAQLGPGRADLTTEPCWIGAPAPIGLAVTPDLGGLVVLPGVPAEQIDGAWWYALGDGHDQDGWHRYRDLMQHLRP